jgi:hypothetical protein
MSCGADAIAGAALRTGEKCETGGARHGGFALALALALAAVVLGLCSRPHCDRGLFMECMSAVSLAPNRASRAAAQQAAQAQDSLLHPALHLVGAVGYCCHGSIQ